MSKNFLLLLFFTNSLFAIDERSLVRILNYKNETKREEVENKKNQNDFTLDEKYLSLDIGGSNNKFIIGYQKIDGFDQLKIYNQEREILFIQKFTPQGNGAYLYKIHKINLSKNVTLLVCFYDEGKYDWFNFKNSARVYFITLDSANNTFYGYKGPLVWIEEKKINDDYYQRYYFLKVEDIDGDGTKEIIIENKHIHYVFKYLGRGNWFFN